MGKGRVRPGDERDEDQYEYEDENEEYEEPPIRPIRRSYNPQAPRRSRHRYDEYAPQRARRYYAPSPGHVVRSPGPRRAVRNPYPNRSPRSTPPPPRRRSVWPFLFGGCAIGILFTVIAAAAVVFFTFRASQGNGVPVIGGLGNDNTQAVTHQDTQAVTLSSITQIQICDKIGNVSIVVDPNASTASITTTKIVHTATKASADQEFGRIGVSVQQLATNIQDLTCSQAQPQASPTLPSTPATPTTPTSAGSGLLTVNTTIPNSDGFIHNASDAVDMRIILSPRLLSNASTPLQLNIEAALGDVNVDGLSGTLTIKGSSGNVTVTHATLISGSSIGTGQGDVTFNGILATPADTTTQASFIIRNEKGKVDVTLPSMTNVVLNANTNVGAIHSDFPITATSSSGSASYRGPLNTSATTQSAAVLTLDVSTGDIYIHKSA